MIADLEAGIGTLTRLADASIDIAVVVVEATPKSIDVGARAAAVARERGIGRVVVVANRARGGDDLARLRAAFPDTELVAVPDDPAIVAAERDGLAPLDTAPDAPAVRALVGLARSLA